MTGRDLIGAARPLLHAVIASTPECPRCTSVDVRRSTIPSPFGAVGLYRHRCRACGGHFYLRAEQARQVAAHPREAALELLQPAASSHEVPAAALDSCLDEGNDSRGEPAAAVLDALVPNLERADPPLGPHR